MRNEPGAVLLEVIVAVTILSIAGVTAVTMAAQSFRTVQRARIADAEMRSASAFLDAVVLWPREDLNRRLGQRKQGPWYLRIGRPAPTLYTVTLVDTLSGRVLLRTSLFRPDPDHARP